IVASIKGVFEIVKHLKGKKPRKIEEENDNTKITNNDGEILYTDKLACQKFFENAKIEGSVINIVNEVKKDFERPGFKIRTSDVNSNSSVEYSRQDFDMIKPIVDSLISERDDILVNIIDATLLIRKPDLIGKSKWGFVFDRNIEASIEDENWLSYVREQNIKFGKGMKLPVKLKIEVRHRGGDQIIDTAYTVLEVTGDIIEDEKLEQMNLII
ncbi:MAG: hypothetical protein ACLTJN_05245, partial [Monoglobus pectinilyticus]